MKKLIIHRKKKFASALMDYWIITGIDKKAFMEKYNLVGDMCKTSLSGHPISRISYEILSNYPSISNGESGQLELDDSDNTVFAITVDGNLSNEIILNNGIEIDGITVFNYCLTTRGGFIKTSYPWFIECVCQAKSA